jgi:hypothetical protein
VRFLLPFAVLLLTGCGPGLVFNLSPEMTKDQMLARADHIFVGVIEEEQLERWVFLKVPGSKNGDWAIVKRRVRIESVIRGQESRPSVLLYEYFPTLGVTGDWNSTGDGERDLFLIRVENGRYHLVRDFWRSIFCIYSGKHDRLPLDDSHPFWERIGLLNWWLGEGHGQSPLYRRDPGNALGLWRTAKIARGLLRHPEREMRVLGCQTLVFMGRHQDECWEQLSPEDRAIWSDHGIVSAERFVHSGDDHAMDQWDWAVAANDIDMMRLLTTANYPRVRREFCRLFAQRFPNDHDNGCPADQPPPATIVTQDGDIPLIGPWPQMRE